MNGPGSYPAPLREWWHAHPGLDAVDHHPVGWVVLWAAVAGFTGCFAAPVHRFTREEIARAFLDLGEFRRRTAWGDWSEPDEVEILAVERAAEGLPVTRWDWSDVTSVMAGDVRGPRGAEVLAFRLRDGLTGGDVREALARAQCARRAA